VDTLGDITIHDDDRFFRFFVHVRADELPRSERYLFGDLLSHRGTMEVHGLPYQNNGDRRWHEVAWVQERLGPLLRTLDLDLQQQLSAVVLADFSTRQQILDWAAGRFPTVAWQLSLSFSRFAGDGVGYCCRRVVRYADFQPKLAL
jgi:hypothetical protein